MPGIFGKIKGIFKKKSKPRAFIELKGEEEHPLSSNLMKIQIHKSHIRPVQRYSYA